MKLSFFIISMFMCICSFCQNLIPNPGFESNSSIPSGLDQISLCDDWSNANSASVYADYYHVDGGLTADLPTTPAALVSPHDGDAIAGFSACGKQGSNYREYLDVKLNSPLEVGKKYNVSFYITNGEVFGHSFCGLGVDNIGVNFSSSQLNQTGNVPLNETPEFVITEVKFSRVWEEISFSFVANEASEYMTIGVFGDDSNTNVTFFEGTSSLAEYAYYFFDDFKMEEIPNETLEAEEDREIASNPIITTQGNFPFFVPNAFTPDGDGNNDTFEVVGSAGNVTFTVLVFDRWGNEIYSAKSGNPSWDGRCNDSLCPSGIYIWLVRYSTSDKDGSPVEKEQSGTVHLIR